MKIYQIIYNSSASGLSGSSGFGVRTASEGTPQNYIKEVSSNSLFHKYLPGKFNIPSDAIFKSPERIYEYPRGYYYKILQIDGKKVYVIGRIVNICFEQSFYVTGSKTTRSGNYVAHVLMTDEFPGKKVFNLLAESAKDDEAYFIPRDYTPVQTNPELVELTVGKPQSALPLLSEKFPKLPMKWDAKSLDLLFSYRAALKEQKPIMVSLSDAVTASTVSMFMNLLPDSLVEETTFVINHQTDSYAKDVKIAFINEYYQYTVYPNLCTYINLMDGSRQADKIEEIWRPILEKALNDNDDTRVEQLVNWVFGRMADDNVNSSADLNEALFNYSQKPSEFTLNTIDKVDNILDVINKYVKQGDITAKHLNNLVIELLKDAAELDDFAKVIDYCEKIYKAGLDASEAKSCIQSKFTDFVISDSENLYNAFVLLKDTILRKYSITEKYPKFEKVIPEVLSKYTDMQQVIMFAKYLQNDSRARVETYVMLLNKAPEYIRQYSSLLDSDKADAEKADYIAAYKAHHDNTAFAQLFYQQVRRESETRATIEVLKKIFDLSEVNTEFTGLIFDDKQIYSAIYNRVKRDIRKEDYSKVKKAIEAYIFSLLPTDSKDRKQWQLLHDVLSLELPNDNRKIFSFYDLAKEIMHVEALKKVAPLCFEVLGKDDIEEFLLLLKQHDIMTDSRIVVLALSKKSKHHLSYVIPVAKMYEYDYDKIFDLILQCGISEKETKKIIKSDFPELYKKHRRDTFFAKIKSLFTKKKKNKE